MRRDHGAELVLRRVLGATALGVLLIAAEARAAEPIEVVARDASVTSGLAAVSHTYGATVADWNDDGQDDALVNLHYDSFPRMRVNAGGSFADVTDAWFLGHPPKRDYHGCAAADVDLNGELDLYCTVGGHKGGTGANRKELWLQEPAGTFTEQAAEWGVRDEFGRGRQATFIDANGDQFPDLYVTNQQPRKDGRPGPNRLFVNEGGERYRSAPGFRLNKQIGGYVAQAADYDGDGREDLLLCSQRGVRIFRNVANRRFKPVTRRVRASGGCLHVALARMNADARPDLVTLSNKRGLRVAFQGVNGRFRRKPAFRDRIRRASTFALGDVNADQLPDLYVVRANRFDPGLPRDAQVDLRDVMLVSAGTAGSYARMPIPQTTDGIGESATAIDHDDNGLSDFIVMNGRHQASGPIRLIAFDPAP
jgi:hypothetical protein